MEPRPSTPFDDLDATAVLTAAEVAARMRVDPRSVRRAAGRGDLRASRACGLRILAADAAAWWQSCCGATSLPVLEPARADDGEDAVVVPARPRLRARSVRPRRDARLPLPPRKGAGS